MLEPANGCEAEHNHHSHTKTNGPEILRNKVHTGWGWQILLWKNLRIYLVQKNPPQIHSADFGAQTYM